MGPGPGVITLIRRYLRSSKVIALFAAVFAHRWGLGGIDDDGSLLAATYTKTLRTHSPAIPRPLCSLHVLFSFPLLVCRTGTATRRYTSPRTGWRGKRTAWRRRSTTSSGRTTCTTTSTTWDSRSGRAPTSGGTSSGEAWVSGRGTVTSLCLLLWWWERGLKRWPPRPHDIAKDNHTCLKSSAPDWHFS
jgi:hypothetical protein